MTRIALIGAGNMGAALCRGLLNVFPADALSASDHHAEKLRSLGVKKTSTDPNDILPLADFVILAVKPQSFRDLMRDLRVPLTKKLIVSVMAGVTLARLARATGANAVVRAMPNLGAAVGHGVTGWVASKNVTREQKQLVQKILSSTGIAFELRSEAAIDNLTALSGSGPAYFFLLSEMLEREARRLGFSEDEARRIAEETFVGSAELLARGAGSAKSWRESVTSKGGTTAAALKTLKKHKFDATFRHAIEASRKRSRELGR
jgi:pyrroline-5-carboxylate reductase